MEDVQSHLRTQERLLQIGIGMPAFYSPSDTSLTPTKKNSKSLRGCKELATIKNKLLTPKVDESPSVS